MDNELDLLCNHGVVVNVLNWRCTRGVVVNELDSDIRVFDSNKSCAI